MSIASPERESNQPARSSGEAGWLATPAFTPAGPAEPSPLPPATHPGIYEFGPIEAVTPEHFHKQFDLNVLGLLLTTQEAVKHLGPGGSIINISSVAATAAMANTSVYSATKAGVDAITRWDGSANRRTSRPPPSSSPRTRRAGSPARCSTFRAAIANRRSGGPWPKASLT